MSANTQVIVIEANTPSVLPAPSSRSSLRRRKPLNPHDVEATQLNRAALLDRIRNRRHHPCQCRRDEPSSLHQEVAAFGKKVLNKQHSKSVNDVKEEEVVGQLRKSSSSQAIPQKCSWCNFDDLRIGFRSSRAHTMIDLTKTEDLTPEIAISEEKENDEESEDCKIVELHEKSQAEIFIDLTKTADLDVAVSEEKEKSEESKTCRIVEVLEKPQAETLTKSEEEVQPKSPKQIPKRQLSKSVNDISISAGHFGMKVIGSEKIALSQIWTVPTNCGCCEPGKEGDCKRLKVQELRQKFTKEEVSPVKAKAPEIPKAEETVDEKSKIPEISKVKPEIPVNTAKTIEVPNVPKEVIKESTKLVIAAICAKPTETEQSKTQDIPKTQEVVKESAKPAIPPNPAKSTEPEKPKAAEVTKPKEVVQQAVKPVVPAKPAEPVKPEATPTDAAEVEEDANIIVKVLTWMGFWSTTKPADSTTTVTATTTETATTAAATKATTATTTTTAAATKPPVTKPATTIAATTATTKPATITAPITTTTAATVTIPKTTTTTTTSTSKIESPPKLTNPIKPDDTTTKPEWVELQVPVVPREGIAKDANEGSTITTAKVSSRLYLNVLVETGSGLISITPVASYELLIKTSVVVWDAVQEEDHQEEVSEELKKLESVQQQFDLYAGPGLYFAFS